MSEDPKTSWGAVIPVAPYIAAFLCYFFFPSIPVNVIVGILLVITIPFLVLSRIAARRLRDPRRKDLPHPADFWRTLFFHVAPSTITARDKFKIMIVHDEFSLDAAREVAARHSGPEWNVQLLPINPKIKGSTDILPKKLEEADAVYFCWTEKVRGNDALLKALDEWTAKKSEVPLLMVNPLNIPYDLKFASMSPSDTGPAHLLFHSISRSQLWIQLAQRLYRWSSYLTVLCLLAALTLIYGGEQLRHAQYRLAERDTIDDTGFNNLATALSGALRNETSPANGPVMLNDSLDKIAKFSLSDIVKTAEADSTTADHISVFRKIDSKEPNRQGLLVEVVGPSPSVQFYPDRTSIAGCAVTTTSFVLWEKGCKQNAPAAWDTFGREIGSCMEEKDNDKYSTILLDKEHGSAVCTYKPSSKLLNNRGVLCFSPAVQNSANQSSGDTAVCLVTPGSTDWLHLPSVRSKLRIFALVANSLPTNSLVPPQKRAEYEAYLKQHPNETDQPQ